MVRPDVRASMAYVITEPNSTGFIIFKPQIFFTISLAVTITLELHFNMIAILQDRSLAGPGSSGL